MWSRALIDGALAIGDGIVIRLRIPLELDRFLGALSARRLTRTPVA